MIFEDPDGTRILFDPGRTVRGGGDPRLGKIDAVLLSHLHFDHLGDVHAAEANAGECGKPEFSVKVTPQSNTVDSGITAEQDLVVHRYYKANLAVMNIGGVFTTGPVEAAYVINTLVKPKSVIASHANEAATKGGKPLPTSKTALFKKTVKVPVYVPLSGKTMEFDGSGKCAAGC